MLATKFLSHMNLLLDFKKNDDFWRVVKNSGWLIVDKLARGFFTLFVGIWVARYLGPGRYGELSYVISFLAFFQVASTLGLDNIVVRDIAHVQHDDDIKNPKEKLGEILGTVFVMRMVAGILFWIIATAGMAIFSSGEVVFLVFLAGAPLLFQSVDTIDIWFQSQSQSRLTVLAKMFAYTLANGIRIVFIMLELPLIYFALAILIEWALAAGALIYAYRSFNCGSRMTLNLQKIGIKLIKESWPYLLSGIAIISYQKIDQLMIKWLIGEYSLGIYSAILPLATTWYFVPMIFSVGLMPILAKKMKISRSKFLHLFRNIYMIFLTIGIVISALVATSASLLVSLLFGNTYELGVNALSIYSLSIIPASLGFAYNLYLVNEGKSQIAFYRTLAGAFVTFLFGWYLIPLYGLEGASIAAVMGYIVSDLLMPIILSNNLFLILINKYHIQN